MKIFTLQFRNQIRAANVNKALVCVLIIIFSKSLLSSVNLCGGNKQSNVYGSD